MRHAYLFILTGNQPVVEAAIRMIDDSRNDIFILASESERKYYGSIKTNFSKIVVIETNIVVTWSGTLWEGMLELIKVAAPGHYAYYHLLSETCLPIKTQDQIHNFFDSQTQKLIYMHVNCHTFKSIQERCKTKYPFVYWKNFRKHKSIKLLALIIVKIKIFFGVNRLKNNKELPVIWNGWNWFSIPDDFAQYAVSKEDLLHRTFDYTLASDEVFLQTLAMNSETFKNRMYGFNGRDDAMDASKRFIKWNTKRWTPLVFKEHDFEEIISQPYFFARKFKADVDMKIVQKLENFLAGEKKT